MQARDRLPAAPELRPRKRSPILAWGFPRMSDCVPQPTELISGFDEQAVDDDSAFEGGCRSCNVRRADLGNVGTREAD